MKKNSIYDIGLLASAIEQSPSPVMITDVKGEIEFVNKVFEKMTGYLLEELKGKSPRVLKSGLTSPETYEVMWREILAGGIWRGELTNKRKDGSIYVESISISSIKNAKENITHFVAVWEDITKKKREEEKLVKRSMEFEKQSRTDDLTGQYNRRHIFVELEREVERALRYSRHLSGMMLDVDNFKMINDKYGHLMGDRILQTFSSILAKSIRRIDILGRYGGDEFIIILPEAKLEIAKLVAERIQKNLLEYKKEIVGDMAPLSASIGLLTFEDVKELDKNIFIEKIDQALLKAKKAGKNKIVIG